MSSLNLSQAVFELSAAKVSQLPPDKGVEIAFVGRSNAGKSSALNAMTNQKNLARTSKTPGRTQLLNVFTLDDSHRLIDLPGYGYAKASVAAKEEWQNLVSHYCHERKSLKGLIILMDIRHPLTELDEVMLDWSIASEIPAHILLTKADKLSFGAAKQVLFKCSGHPLIKDNPLISIQLFSSPKKMGLTDAIEKIQTWLGSE